jgi:predicted nucleotidyltransferase
VLSEADRQIAREFQHRLMTIPPVLDLRVFGSRARGDAAPQSLTLPRQDLLDEIVQHVVRVVQPRRILLFGSAARGRLGPDSDLDLLVIVREPVHRRAVAQEIYRNLHGILLPVDVVVVTERDVEQYGDKVGTILRPALREGQVIYEA